jgi:hypothetical protein
VAHPTFLQSLHEVEEGCSTTFDIHSLRIRCGIRIWRHCTILRIFLPNIAHFGVVQQASPLYQREWFHKSSVLYPSHARCVCVTRKRWSQNLSWFWKQTRQEERHLLKKVEKVKKSSLQSERLVVTPRVEPTFNFLLTMWYSISKLSTSRKSTFASQHNWVVQKFVESWERVNFLRFNWL